MSATAGNVTVHVTAAEGVLPSGAQLIVKRVTRKAILNAVEETVTEKDKEVDSAIALDITIVNADGIEIQPNGIVNVSFENVAVGGEEVNVYHVTDDASTVTEVATNTQSFDANHFSIYVITGEKKVELTTFNFVANEQNVSTQIVKTGDTLITPTAPDIAGKAFVEWQENGSKFDGFGVQTITKTETRTITAKYEDALYVYFYNPGGTQIMRTEKVADHDGHDYSHVSYDVDATHKLVGWAAEVNGTDNITKNIVVPEGSTSVNVYAIIKEGYWVTFDSDGGSAIDSQFVFDKISLNDQTTPTKPGYTFDGWYNGTEKVENDANISSPMTLTAHWIPKQVSYTVIHWWENADDDGYSFHESENKTGLTGTEANAKAKSYEGFTAQPVTKKTIKGDGSTIVSVYYKRNVYDVKFYSYGSYSFWDYTKPEEYVNLRITAKYGQDISKQWPTKNGSSTWSTEDHGTTYQANINTMPLGGAKFYGPQTGNYYCEALYYVEILPGENSSITVGGIKYRLDHTDKMYGSNITITKEDLYPLKGFTLNESISARIGQKYNGAKFYYTRNPYDLKFINNGKQDKTVTKKYEQSISSENYTPARPSSLPEYYLFDGWYENELCEGEAYNFTGKKMPAQNVTLYAKWTAKKINLTYNLNNPEGAVDKDTKKVEAGTVANTVLPSIPTINEYSFAGWYYADGNGNITSEVFNTNNTITRDTSIVGKWLYKGELRVVYKPGAETGATVPTDDKVYAGGAKVTVAGNATTTSNMKFLGWELNGNIYKPGQSFEVNKDIANKDNQIILTATWGDAETSTTLTYDPGNGIGTAKRVDVMNNEAVEIEAHGSLGFKAPVAEGKEYYFAGWADSSTGNATYADGQTINIDANGENVLYAVWVEKAKITVVAKSDEITYDGNNHILDGFNSLTIDGYTVSGLSASVSGTDAGTYNNVITGEATVTKDGKDVTNRVVVTKQNGTLTINKRQVTLTSEGGSKPYDGTALTKPDVAIGGLGFVNGEVKDIKATGSVTNVSDGEVTNTITYTANEKFNENNYQITKTEGKLSITAVEAEVQVQIVGATDTVGYDGNPHQEVLVVRDAELDKTLKSGKDYDVSYSTKDFTNVGEITITITGKGNYVGTVNKTYSITKRQVTLTSEGGSKPYDGTPLTRPDVTVGGDGFVTGEVTSVQAIGTVTEVKDSPVTNAIEYTVGTKFNINNYEISMTEGTLSITPKSINPDDQNMSVSDPQGHVYDGLEHKEELEVKDIFRDVILSAGTDYDVAYSTKDFTNVGKIIITITGKGNYTGTFDRTYEITPATLTVTTPSVNKVYDGTPLTAEGTISGFVNKETATFTTTGSQTEVGSSSNTYLIEWDGTAKSSNYKISETVGTLTVTENENEIVVTTKHSSYTYDGLAHGTEVTVSDLPKGYSLDKATSSATATDVTTAIEATCDTLVIKNAEGKDVTNNLKITKVPGSITITPATLTVTTPSANKVYDGTPLTADGTISGFVNKETATFTTTGSQTEVGNSKNTYSIKWNGTAKSTNYQISEAVGTLTVTQQSIDPEDPENNYNGVTINKPSNKVYDGKEHKWSPAVADKEGNALVEGTDYEVTYSTSDFRNVTGTITVTITGVGNYTGKVTRTYEITPKAYTVTTDSANKVYDGTALTAGGKIEGIVDGEVVVVHTTGSQTEVGSTPNTYKLEWKKASSKNYKLKEDSIGTLTVTEQTIDPGKDPDNPNPNYSGVTINKPSNSVYDGKEHKWSPAVADKEGNALVEGTDYEVTYSTSDFRNVTGTITVTITGVGNYTGKVTRTYEITPKAYTVTTDSANKVYDGTALTAGGKIEGIVDGEVVVVHTTGSQTEVGSTPNTYKLEWKKASSKNYKLKEDSIGTLTVTEQTIDPGKDPDNPNPNYSGVTINNPSNSVYDGKEHKWSPAVTDKEGNALVEGTDYEVAYSTSDFTNVTGTITVTITGIGNYTGTVTRTYEITPKAYTVTTNSAKKVYDGTALTAGGKIEGIVSGETVEFTTTGSRTVEGTSKNTYSLKWNGSAIQTNYKLAKESIGELTVKSKSIIPDEPNTPDDKKTGITVSDPKDSKYDGQEHREVLTVKDIKTGKDLIANKDYTVVYSDDLVNAGTVKVTVTGLGNYSGSFTKTYKITKRLVTLTSATVSKTYDGQALTNTSITVSGDGFVEGEGASYEVTGTQTKVGNSANAFEYKLNENTLASNYDITKVVGTLTITAAPAPVTPPTSPTPVSPPPVTPRYIQQVVPAPTPQEEVKKEKTPKAEPKEEKVEKVEKEKTPKARPEKFWALINLICAIVTVLFGLLLLISKRHKNKDDEEDETKDQTTTNEDEEKEQEKKRGAFTRVLAVLIAILSVVFFLVTEDMSLRWTWTDQWTIWMVVIGLVQIVVFFVGRKWKNVDDDEDEQAQQA